MKIAGTKSVTKITEVEHDLKSHWKEPVLTLTLDGMEVCQVELAANMVRSASGADDILALQVSLSGTDGDMQTLTKQVHLPTLAAESKAAEAKPEAPTQTGV